MGNVSSNPHRAPYECDLRRWSCHARTWVDTRLGVAQGRGDLVETMLGVLVAVLPPICMYLIVIHILWRFQ